jgi:hypothetical protein
MTYVQKLRDIHLGLVREVITHMNDNSLAEIEFKNKIRINVDEHFGDDYHMVPAMVIGLNGIGDLYLDDSSSISVTQISIHELAYILDRLVEKEYIVNEFETTPDK